MKPLNIIKYETFIIGTCPNCGQARLNNRDNNFCGCCGTEIEWEQGCNETGRALRKIGTSSVSESEHEKGWRFPDVETVIKGLEACTGEDNDCAGHTCPYWDYDEDAGCRICMELDALALLKEQEVRELTMDEWREWKENPKRNPICELWEKDTSPMWILNPNDVHEPALLMGKLKLFTGKPTFEQCKEVKWDDYRGIKEVQK